MENSRQAQHQPPAGLAVGDIYYVLFRHKWKIIILSLAGIVAAAAFYRLNPPPYQSQAELLIKYVPEAGTLPLAGGEQKMFVPDSQGAGIINSEIRILTSLDVAKQAVTNIGAAKILAKISGGDNLDSAAALIARNLKAEPADAQSGVIIVTFTHPDLQIVQPVLQEVINDYKEKHIEIHSPGGQYDDAIRREGADLRSRLLDTEQQIANLKESAHIVSTMDDARKDLAGQISTIQGSIREIRIELVGYEAAMKQAGDIPAEKPEATNAPTPVPLDQVDAYNSICTTVELLRKKQQDYLLQGFTRSSLPVSEVNERLASTLKAKEELERKWPQVAGLRAAAVVVPGGQPGAAPADPRAQVANIASLQDKLKAWEAELDQLQTQSTNLNKLAPTIAELERQKAILQINSETIATKMEASLIESAIDPGKTPNIKMVQDPSPPLQDWKKIRKMTAMLALGGVLAGLGWAFLIELVLDRSLRRPTEIEARLKVPLLLSIPDVRRNSHRQLAGAGERRQLRLNDAAKSGEARLPATGGGPNGNLEVVSLEQNPALQPFCEALRDRLIVYFEVRNLTHKPKLLAVTSSGHGAGVSSIAAGLAHSLSETGDGNVLLVDMNVEQGAAQQFYKGKPGCGLDTALTADTKQNALVQEHLYVVNGNANSSELPRILPKRFSALVPKLKASDYDYIIFDMPPVNQTSLTSRLARFMDMTLLVVESEKSNREVVQQANKWLAESGATVGAVLNKTRQYVPERLHQEFLDDK